jgi:hypothetical protein
VVSKRRKPVTRRTGTLNTIRLMLFGEIIAVDLRIMYKSKIRPQNRT